MTSGGVNHFLEPVKTMLGVPLASTHNLLQHSQIHLRMSVSQMIPIIIIPLKPGNFDCHRSPRSCSQTIPLCL